MQQFLYLFDQPLEIRDICLIQSNFIYLSCVYKTGERTTDPESQTTTTTTTKKPTSSITKGPKTTDPNNKPTTIKTTATPAPCVNTFKAVLLHRTTQQTYIFNDNVVYVLGKWLGMVDAQNPIPVREIFKGLQSVDALYYNKEGEIVVFSGTK